MAAVPTASKYSLSIHIPAVEAAPGSGLQMHSFDRPVEGDYYQQHNNSNCETLSR